MDGETRAESRSGRLVLWVVAGITLALAATVAAFEAGRPTDAAYQIEMGPFVRAMLRAPWLAGVFGTWAEQAEAKGDLQRALRDYGRVLRMLPSHAGTRLARARVLERSGAVADPATKAAALEDLAVAEQAFRAQVALLAELGTPPGGARAAGMAQALQDLGALRRRIEAAPGSVGGK